MESNCKIFCVTYEDNTKDTLMVFKENVEESFIKNKIFQHLKETNGEIYDDDELHDATDDIIRECSWTNGCDDYYLENSTLYE